MAKLGVSLLVLSSHFLVAILFAVGFWLGAEWDLGGFDKAPTMDWMDYFYFSLINVTTLGLGDIYPTDHLRVLAGIEALTGFALISCSAQLFWTMMHEGEKA
ncbi:MAG TPA: two pore domain potassium channel family protein [Erythrobacter sp.]|nr:two pore domain potassium channel family protein [Erythrobacter sp.]HAW34787.1 two pore domain potassium channel family protein [Erythrobacter sp.]HBQ92007.1 two pore domain potassium channel family protein [Erythrobacter sp.]